MNEIAANDILLQMNEFIILLDMEGKILFINTAALDVLGYKEPELLNKPINMVCQTFPEKFENVEPNKSIPAEFKMKNGSYIAVVMSFSTFSAKGQKNGFIVTASDNGEQLALQKKLSEIVGELEITVEKLKKSEELRHGYIGMVYHELKSPLTSAKGALALIAGNMSAGLTDAQKELLNIAKTGHERLLSMIEELRDASKMESGTFGVVKYSFDINRSVDMAAELTAYDLSAKKLRLVKFYSSPALTMFGDENRIIQVIINLINNAAKFSSENQAIEIGTLKVKPGADAIKNGVIEKAMRNEPYTMLYVRDCGRGIKKEFVEMIFGKYFQVKTEDAGKHKGMGLGLAIVKGIVEAHKGFVWAESEGEGKGTVFKAIFPDTV